MIMAKEEYIAIRTSAKVKETLQNLANEEYRSLSQQCELILVKWLKENGYLKEKKKK